MRLCKVLFISVISLLFFISCTSTKIISDSNISPIYITNTKKLYLLPPGAIEKPVALQQLLTANFGSNTFVLLSYLEADEQGIFLSLYNDFGTGMGNLTYDGMNVTFDSAVFPKNLKAEYILADLQFAYYNVKQIDNLLNSIGMKMTVEKTDTTEIRKVYNGIFLIEEVLIEEKNITIKNKLRGYEYNLQEAE